MNDDPFPGAALDISSGLGNPNWEARPMKIAKIIAVTVIAAGIVGASAGDSRADHQTLLGGLLGGAAGAGIGAAFGGGKGAAIGGVSGLLLGALAGNTIGREKRYSRPPAQGYYAPPPAGYSAYQQPTYAPAYGGATAYTPPVAVPAPPPAFGGNYCRDFNQKIIIDGVEKNAYGKACLQPDGSWRMGEGGIPMRTAAGTVSFPITKIQPRRQPAIYLTVKNANVRAGPSTSTTRITTLPMGTSVTVLEKAEGGDWYRVARGGAALGYIYGPLIRPQ